MSESKTPLVTVVIPTYNHGCYLGRALQSILDQTYTNWEAIVIDNHSIDNTDEVMDSFSDPRISYFKIHNNGVIAASRNAGIQAAKGEWVAFLDSDDWWMPEKLEMSFLAIKNGAELIYHDLLISRSFSQSVFNERIFSTDPKPPIFQALLCSGMSIPNSSVVVSKNLLIQIGGLSEKQDLVSVEDFDTWIRISRITEKFFRIPACLGYYWVGEGNHSSASPTQCARIIALYNQYINELKGRAQVRAKAFLAYRVARIAQNYGDFEKSMEYYKIALRFGLGLSYQAKAVFFLARAKFSHLLGSF